MWKSRGKLFVLIICFFARSGFGATNVSPSVKRQLAAWSEKNKDNKIIVDVIASAQKALIGEGFKLGDLVVDRSIGDWGQTRVAIRVKSLTLGLLSVKDEDSGKRPAKTGTADFSNELKDAAEKIAQKARTRTVFVYRGARSISGDYASIMVFNFMPGPEAKDVSLTQDEVLAIITQTVQP